MAKLGKVLAGLGAALGGYATGKADFEQRRAEDEDRRLRREETEMRMASARKQMADQQALADAGRPAVVEPNVLNDDDGNPTSAPALRMVGPGPVQNFNDPAAAAAMADGMNDPTARRARQVAALDATGRPDQAIALENANWQQGRQRVTAKREDDAHARQLKEEGVVEAWQALGRGDAAGIKDAFNRSGLYKIDGEVTLRKEKRNVPGLGEKETNTADFTMLQPDGSKKPMSVNFHDLATTQLMKYKDVLELGIKGKQADDKSEYQAGLIKARQDSLAVQQSLGEARIENARLRAVQPPAAAPVWNDKADTLLNKVYFGADENGKQAVDAQGALFAKTIARGIATKNGGDAHAGVMKAIEVDNRLREAAAKQAAAAKDPAERAVLQAQALQVLRREYLARISGAAPAAPPRPQPSLEDVRNTTWTTDRTPGGRAPALAQVNPVDRIGDSPIGPLTPMSYIEEAAQAGNPRAIAWLRQRAAGQMENATAPRDAASSLGVAP